MFYLGQVRAVGVWLGDSCPVCAQAWFSLGTRTESDSSSQPVGHKLGGDRLSDALGNRSDNSSIIVCNSGNRVLLRLASPQREELHARVTASGKLGTTGVKPKVLLCCLRN